MNRKWHWLAAGSILTIALLLASNAVTTIAAEDDANKGNFVINLTSGLDDPHSATMAFQLAGHALDDGRHVVIFCNVRGVVLAMKDLPDNVAFNSNHPLKPMLAGLVQRGAELIVCPHCMKSMSVEEGDLIEGAKVATRELLFSRLDSNTVVFSY